MTYQPHQSEDVTLKTGEAAPSELTDEEIDAIQEATDCFVGDCCDIRVHEFARAVARAILSRTPAPSEPVAWQAREMLDEDWSAWKETRGEDLERWRSRVERRPDLYELRPLFAAPVAAALPEPQRPDILERLSYHALERDDLTLDDCLAYLSEGWKTVHGRTERQMVMQILAQLAGAVAAPSGVPADMVLVPREPTDDMQAAGAKAIRWDTSVLNKIWTGNAVFRAMIAAAAGAPTKTDSVHEAVSTSEKVHSGSAPANAPSGEGSAA